MSFLPQFDFLQSIQQQNFMHVLHVERETNDRTSPLRLIEAHPGISLTLIAQVLFSLSIY